MLDERLEAEEYINGIGITKRNVHRACYMMARYYQDAGYSMEQTRKEIFAWAKRYDVFIDFTLNAVIKGVRHEKRPLRTNICVKISNDDVLRIKELFDCRNSRLLAFALLCYAKVNANMNQEFSVSLTGLAHWLNTNYSNMLNRNLTEVIDFGYIERVEFKQSALSKTYKSKYSRFRIRVPLKDDGETMITDNDIVTVFEQLFY